MQSRRDQVQAHQFTVSRLTTGLLRADPDSPEPPLGRTTRGVAYSVLVAVLIAAGALVLGLLRPVASDAWRKPGALVVDKDTGSRYLYLDGVLRPVLNYTSASLFLGNPPSQQRVSGRSLAKVRRGTPIGIVGAPDAPPQPKALTSGAWQVCAITRMDAKGTPTPEVVVDIGRTDAGAALADDEATVVGTPDGTTYVLWRGTRLRVAGDRGVLAALGYSAAPQAVAIPFLDAIPAGPDLTPPDIPGRGEVVAEPNGRVGQVFSVAGPAGVDRLFVLRRDGLVALTPVLAALLLGDPVTRANAYPGADARAIRIDEAVLRRHLSSAASPLASEVADLYPGEVPRPVAVGAGRSACARVEPRGGTPVTRIVVGPTASTVSAAGQPVVDLPGTDPGCLTADRVALPSGGGALVRALPTAGSRGGSVYLVAEPGVKYPLPAGKATTGLGYGDVVPVMLPGALLALLPTGPVLDPGFGAQGIATATARCGGEPTIRQDAGG